MNCACGSPAVYRGKFTLSGSVTGIGYCGPHRPPSNSAGYTVTINAPSRPEVICRVCRRHFHEPRASLAWHANAHGRAVCPDCEHEKGAEPAVLDPVPLSTA